MRLTTCSVLQEAALRFFYLPDEPRLFEMEDLGALQRHHSDDLLNRNAGAPDNRSAQKDGGDARLLRAKPWRDEVIKVHAAWSR